MRGVIDPSFFDWTDLHSVYYERLSSDAIIYDRPKLERTYNEAKSKYREGVSTYYKDKTIASDELLSMASAEASKETKFLKEIFGVDLGEGLTPENTKDLIKAINLALTFKQEEKEVAEKVFNQNVDRLTDDSLKNKQKMYTYFGGYIKKVIREMRDQLAQEIRDKMENNGDVEISDLAYEVLSSHTQEFIVKAFEAMSKANLDEGRRGTKELNEEYIKLYNIVSNFQNSSVGNNILQRLIEVWKLDEFYHELASYVNTGHQSKAKGRTYDLLNNNEKISMNARWLASGSKGTGHKIGAMNEIVRDIGLSEIVSGLQSQGVDVRAVENFGSKGAKADHLLFFNLPIDKTDLNGMSTGSVKDDSNYIKNRDAFNRLDRNISKIKNGFVLEISDKIYKDIEGGYSGGRAMNLDTFEILFTGYIARLPQLIFSILQTRGGAIGENGENQTKMEETIARSFAIFLFDDSDAIGRMRSLRGNVIHIFNLNGVYIPLSSLLYATGMAIKEISTDATRYVSVNIKALAAQTDDAHSFGLANWELARDRAYKNTMISIKFLKHFSQFLSQYVKGVS